VMTVGERQGSMTQAWSVDESSVSTMQRANTSGTGSASVTVHGTGLGLVVFTAMGQIGKTGCEGTEWELETSVQCMTGNGSRGTRRALVTVGERSGSMSQAFSFDMGIVSAVSHSNVAGTGSASVTVHGAGLGVATFTAMGRGGQTGCEGTEWESETSIRCMMGHGAHASRRLLITVGERSGSMSQAFSADVGSLSAVSPSNVARTGSASVMVHGAGLGVAAFTGTCCTCFT